MRGTRGNRIGELPSTLPLLPTAAKIKKLAGDARNSGDARAAMICVRRSRFELEPVMLRRHAPSSAASDAGAFVVRPNATAVESRRRRQAFFLAEYPFAGGGVHGSLTPL
jgi:hypothetical protein